MPFYMVEFICDQIVDTNAMGTTYTLFGRPVRIFKKLSPQIKNRLGMKSTFVYFQDTYLLGLGVNQKIRYRDF